MMNLLFAMPDTDVPRPAACIVADGVGTVVPGVGRAAHCAVAMGR